MFRRTKSTVKKRFRHTLLHFTHLLEEFLIAALHGRVVNRDVSLGKRRITQQLRAGLQVADHLRVQNNAALSLGFAAFKIRAHYFLRRVVPFEHRGEIVSAGLHAVQRAVVQPFYRRHFGSVLLESVVDPGFDTVHAQIHVEQPCVSAFVLLWRGRLTITHGMALYNRLLVVVIVVFVGWRRDSLV